ncbi:alpha amylase [Coprinopsis sp. MPI-PUGE-AT-0042]|nr:alpha amylase [Coprinopsis sp. MPI-PUGE-AT-0042]
MKLMRLWIGTASLLGLAVLSVASPTTLQHQHAKRRAPQVSLLSQAYSNEVLSGTITVQNLAYSKAIEVAWAVGNSWSSSQTIAASYGASGSNNFETWIFSGRAPGATQFYIKYTVSGQTYYDPGDNVNYQVTSTSVPTGTPVALPPIIPSNIPSEAPASAPTGCNNFNGQDSCSGNGPGMAASSERRRWQTPPRGDADYKPTFQDYSHLVGYADIQYNSARNGAVVTVNAAHKTGASLTYSFNGVSQTSPTFQVTSALQGTLAVAVTSSDGKKLELDPLNFVWQHQPLSAAQSSFNNGQKGGIVELFGWPWNDVAKECEFLGKAGYMGVKVWPPNEHVWGSHYYEGDGQFRPWYLVYQPVSYRLQSRMGTRTELRNMINACRRAGVRVYADAVINHMSGQGADIQTHRTTNCDLYSGHNATANSPYFTSGNTYLINPFTKTRPTFEFPAVPFGPTDFHCERTLDDYNNGYTITEGWLVGLTDLNTAKPYVQDRIATYLVDLLSIGFSGFRVDAAKHIGPADLAAILGRFKAKMGGGSLPDDFVTWLEVLMGGEASLMACGGGEWSWYTNFDVNLAASGLSTEDIQKVKIWSSVGTIEPNLLAKDYPKDMPICGSWIIPPSRFAIQNDDHDQQNEGSSPRAMGDQGSVLIKEKDVPRHRFFEVNLFARRDNDWHIKLILSSYMFASNGGSGFPDGLSDCSAYYTGNQSLSGCKGVGKDTAYVAGACLGATSASALGIPGFAIGGGLGVIDGCTVQLPSTDHGVAHRKEKSSNK